MASNKIDVNPNEVNRIINGTEITGDINSNSNFFFEGKLTGNINITGKIVIGQTGVVKGEVKCKNAEVSGKVEGKIVVSELLTLKSTSVIQGDIITNKLAIEPGAKFTGTCNMDNQPSMGQPLGNDEKSKK